MALVVTPARRRIAMAALLALAMAGAVIRHWADNPSTLRDIGTLLLVLWLPAIGMLIGFLARKVPLGSPPPTDFAAGSAFVPHLSVTIEPIPAPEALSGIAGDVPNGTLVVGRRGFTVRAEAPALLALARSGASALPLELLAPAAALPHLAAGTRFHLLIGVTAVAKGHVLHRIEPPSA
jgi:hypothetical protein